MGRGSRDVASTGQEEATSCAPFPTLPVNGATLILAGREPPFPSNRSSGLAAAEPWLRDNGNVCRGQCCLGGLAVAGKRTVSGKVLWSGHGRISRRNPAGSSRWRAGDGLWKRKGGKPKRQRCPGQAGLFLPRAAPTHARLEPFGPYPPPKKTVKPSGLLNPSPPLCS